MSKLFTYVSKALFIILLIICSGEISIHFAMILKRMYLGVPIADLISLDHPVDKNDFKPWVYWTQPEGVSDDVHTDNSTTKIFMFSSLTATGSGVSESDTIPALLQKKLGKGFAIRNYGEKKYVSVQETNALLEKLANGARPDVVIFYDGFSDGFAGVYDPAVPRDVRIMREQFYRQQDMANRGVFGSLLEPFKKSNWYLLANYLQFGDSRGDMRTFKEERDAAVLAQAPQNAVKVIHFWLENCRQVRAIGQEYGFKALCVWQPNALNGQKILTEEETTQINKMGVTPGAREAFKILYSVSSQTLPGRKNNGVFFIGDIFKDINETVYKNHFLTNEKGNAIIAERLYRILNEQF